VHAAKGVGLGAGVAGMNAAGVNIVGGSVVSAPIAEAHGLAAVELSWALS
jgi:NAD/NADP transhydrogenase alpha subunit